MKQKGPLVMFKSTVYKKVNRSRNFFVLLLVILIVLAGGKIFMAHEKMAAYEEAARMVQSGHLVAAEKKFLAAKRNLSVTDHNQDINRKLAILSPIRETMEDLDDEAATVQEEKNLDQLIDIYNRWQEKMKNWVSGSRLQQDMYAEMLALTQLDQDFAGYFSGIKKTQIAKLQKNTLNGDAEEEQVFTILNKIPAEYYGDDPAKTKEIQTAFQQYYAAKIKILTTVNASVAQIVTEGNRQFAMLTKLAIDSGWLQNTLDSHLVKVLTTAIDKKEYAVFAEQANTTGSLASNMKDAKVIPFIEKAKTELLAKAKSLTAGNKYEDAISIYEALKPLENTEELIKNANLAWDQFEPIRVLKRLYPTKEFPIFVNAKNKWGADIVIAAISKDYGIYFGKLKGKEAMAVTEGTLDGSPAVTKLEFDSSFTSSNNPVIYIEAKSKERKYHYLAYEARSGALVKILDVEADNLTVEAKQVLVVDNPVGPGAGELAYYETDPDGTYHFTKIKEASIDIQKGEITNVEKVE
ncbi:hypothetical protein [Bacillus salipaludis]|uniref:SbsC C-terminal domain-containing protein n=1 Tax=Bacillus salipaludis TaxID=2547811 RepID=A0ABW8R9Y9_9BACI